MFDDVRPHSQGRTFIFPVGFGGGKAPSQPSPKRALKNYRYFHFIGVVRRHYRAFTRRSGYDVW